MSSAGALSSPATHVGTVRDHNEDTYVDRPDLGLWAVADGAGGHESGEVASGLIARALQDIPLGLSAGELLASVRKAISDTHAALRTMAAQRGQRAMIASTVVILIVRDEHYACLWAGDSRAYLLRAGQFSQLTRDHSLVQDLLDGGMITPEEVAGHPRGNIITRAVGASSETLQLDKASDRLLPGDRFLLCSDGLSKTLGDTDLAALLAAGTQAQPFIAAALARRVDDNVTAVIVDVPGERPGFDPDETLRPP